MSERFPGMRELAEKTFGSTPPEMHWLVTRKMKYYLDMAKLRDVATTMDWSKQSLNRLKEQFGPVPDSITQVKGKKISKEGLENAPISSEDAAAQASIPASPASTFQMAPKTAPKTAAKTVNSIDPAVKACFLPKKPAKTSQAGPTPKSKTTPNIQAKTIPIAKPTTPKGNKTSKPITPKGTTTSESTTPLKGTTMLTPTTPEVTPSPKGSTKRSRKEAAKLRAELRRQGSEPQVVPSALPAVSSSPISSTPKRSLATQASKKPETAAKRQKQLIESRMLRFQTKSAPSPYMDKPIASTIVGTSASLEKPYFRITGQVNPETVRPPEILGMSLDYVLEKYEKNSQNYAYISEQLQSIRQDLTVQHIETNLAVKVYETNCRISLQHQDLSEFNKCLSRVFELYKVLKLDRDEFNAYSVYYKLLLREWRDLSNEIIREDKLGPKNHHPALNRALMCVKYTQAKDARKLVAIAKAATPLEKQLLQHIVHHVQALCLEAFFSATYPQNQLLPLEAVAQFIGIKTHEVKVLLNQWKVPWSIKGVYSEKALPAVRQVAAQLIDLK